MVGQYRTRSPLEGAQSGWSIQDHHWNEHKVVGQYRTRSPLEGAQSGWSIQDHHWKEHKVVNTEQNHH